MKHSTHKYGKPYHRKVHVDGGEWSWRAADNNVWIRSPDGKMTIRANAFEVSGITLKEWMEVAHNNRQNMPSIDTSPYPPVIPSDIVETIKNVMVAK